MNIKEKVREIRRIIKDIKKLNKAKDIVISYDIDISELNCIIHQLIDKIYWYIIEISEYYNVDIDNKILWNSLLDDIYSMEYKISYYNDIPFTIEILTDSVKFIL